jgi:hypothetical protein
MTSIYVLDRQRASSAASNGQWTTTLDGGITLKKGQSFTLQTAIVHLPFSNAVVDPTSIIVPNDITTTITFGIHALDYSPSLFLAPYDMADPTVIYTAIPTQKHLYYCDTSMGGGAVKKFTFTFTVPKGTYDPVRLASMITEQSVQVSKSPASNLNPDLYGTDLSTGVALQDWGTPTWRSDYEYRDFDMGAAAFYNISDPDIPFNGFSPAPWVPFVRSAYDFPLVPGTTLDTNAQYWQIGSNQGIVVQWNSILGRFIILYAHTPITDNSVANGQGNVSIIRQQDMNNPPFQFGVVNKRATFFATFAQGLYFDSKDDAWGSDEDNWSNSIWFYMGFQWSDLNNPTDLPGIERIVYTDNKVLPAHLDNTHYLCDYLAEPNSKYYAVGQGLDETNYLGASNPPYRSYDGQSLWNIRITLTKAGYKSADGEDSYIVGTVSRTFSSNDCFISQGTNPTYPVLEDSVVSAIQVEVLNFQTGTVDPSLGPGCIMQLQINGAPGP